MGLHWLGLNESYPLNIGPTTANFKDSGNLPVEKHSFTSSLKMGGSALAAIFKILDGILSGPAALLDEKLIIMMYISPGSIHYYKLVVLLRAVANS